MNLKIHNISNRLIQYSLFLNRINMKKTNLLIVLITSLLLVAYACNSYELKDDVIKAEEIKITNAMDGVITLGDKQRVTVEFQILPENVSLKYVTFESSDTTIFKVYESGQLIPLGVGTANLIVRTKDNSGVKTTVRIDVYKEPVMLEGIVIKNAVNGIIRMIKGQKNFVETEIAPNDATIQTLAFESSNTAVFTVSANGEITAIDTGIATLTIKATDGSEITATCTINVLNESVKVSSITLAATSKSFMLGEEPFALNPTILPVDATSSTLVYTSSDPTVASVDEAGKVTPLKSGVSVITVAATDGGGAETTCNITVSNEYSMTNWTVTASSIEGYEGGGPMSILDTSTAQSTFWVNKWQGGSAPLPHWLLIDMKKEVDITKFLFRRRETGHPYAQDTKKVEISYSNNVANVNSPQDSEFISAGVIDFGSVVPESSMAKEKELDFNAKARYLRMKITESNRGSEANVGYIKVFGK